MSLVARDASNAIIVNRNYEYDAVGNKLKETRDEDGSRREIEYDALDRLVQVTYHSSPAEVQQYTYDAVGNRLTKTVDGELTTYTFDADDRLIKEEAPTETITYVNDNNGNRISKTDSEGTYSHEYDFEIRLIGFTKPSGEYVADQYSPQGLKLSRYKWSGTWGHSTYYLWSGRDVIEERGEEDQVYTRYNPGISAVLDPGTEREWLMYPLYDSFGSSAAEILPDETRIVDFDEFGIKREGCMDEITQFLNAIYDTFVKVFTNGYDPSTGTYTVSPYIRQAFVNLMSQVIKNEEAKEKECDKKWEEWLRCDRANAAACDQAYARYEAARRDLGDAKKLSDKIVLTSSSESLAAATASLSEKERERVGRMGLTVLVRHYLPF